MGQRVPVRLDRLTLLASSLTFLLASPACRLIGEGASSSVFLAKTSAELRTEGLRLFVLQCENRFTWATKREREWKRASWKEPLIFLSFWLLQVYVWNVDTQPERGADAKVAGSAASVPDLELTGHKEFAEFALAFHPKEPRLISGGEFFLQL